MNANLICDDLNLSALPAKSSRQSTATRGTECATAGIISRPRVGHGRSVRFEAITVRAAARVLRLQQRGVVTEREAVFYLHELADMDARAGRDAFPSLLRAARKRIGG